jgi:hypothetical protein
MLLGKHQLFLFKNLLDIGFIMMILYIQQIHVGNILIVQSSGVHLASKKNLK